jgi:hypothetical protein
MNSTLYHLSKRGVPCATSRSLEPKVHLNSDLNLLKVKGLYVNKVIAISKLANLLRLLELHLKEVNKIIDLNDFTLSIERLSKLK